MLSSSPRYRTTLPAGQKTVGIVIQSNETVLACHSLLRGKVQLTCKWAVCHVNRWARGSTAKKWWIKFWNLLLTLHFN